MEATAIAIEHQDVRGNKLKYLKVSNEKGQVLIHVGQKTFDEVNKLTSDEPNTNKKQHPVDDTSKKR